VSFGYILAVVTTVNLGGLLNGLAYGRGAVGRVESEKRNTIGTRYSTVLRFFFWTLAFVVRVVYVVCCASV